jgi:hypothetical protein
MNSTSVDVCVSEASLDDTLAKQADSHACTSVDTGTYASVSNAPWRRVPMKATDSSRGQLWVAPFSPFVNVTMNNSPGWAVACGCRSVSIGAMAPWQNTRVSKSCRTKGLNRCSRGFLARKCKSPWMLENTLVPYN